MVIQPNTRETIYLHNWLSRLVESLEAQSYHVLVYDQTPLRQNSSKKHRMHLAHDCRPAMT